MDFWRTVLVLFRRWYITLPAFFAALGLAGAAYVSMPVEYESRSILVLTTPLSGGSESTQADRPNPVTNPMMNFDQSLALAASVVIQQLSSSETAQALGVHPGDTTTYDVNNGTTNPELLQSGPFLFVHGTAASPGAARDITSRVSDTAASILEARQKELNAPPSTYIEMQVVVAPTAGQMLEGSPLRAAAAVGGLASLASLASVYGFESLMLYRRSRRRDEPRGGRDDDRDPPGGGPRGGPDRAARRPRPVPVGAGRPAPAREPVPSGSLRLVRASSAPEER
jgi:hypothetical protein